MGVAHFQAVVSVSGSGCFWESKGGARLDINLSPWGVCFFLRSGASKKARAPFPHQSKLFDNPYVQRARRNVAPFVWREQLFGVFWPVQMFCVSVFVRGGARCFAHLTGAKVARIQPVQMFCEFYQCKWCAQLTGAMFRKFDQCSCFPYLTRANVSRFWREQMFCVLDHAEVLRI